MEGSDKILDRAMRQLKENTQLTRFSPGSKAKSLLAIVAEEAGRLEEMAASNLVLSLTSGATGIYLDYLGDLVGTRRGQRQAATALEADRLVKITVEDGSPFGVLNNGRRIVIPAGTQVSSADGEVRFALLGRADLSPNNTEHFVGIRALKLGSAGNVPAGLLTKIDFENYASHPTLNLKVENISSIETGADKENDTFYRYRITNAVLSAEKANLTAIRLAALSVQAVADVLILPLYRGIGTADIILDTATGIVSPAVIEGVMDAVGEVQSLGTSINVRPPRLVGLEVAADLQFRSGLSQGDRKRVKQDARQAVVDLIPQVFLGGTLAVNLISSAIFNSSKDIVDIGSPGAPLTETILWRDSFVTRGRRPEVLTGSNIVLATDERLVLEGTIEQAVRITEK